MMGSRESQIAIHSVRPQNDAGKSESHSVATIRAKTAVFRTQDGYGSPESHPVAGGRACQDDFAGGSEFDGYIRTISPAATYHSQPSAAG